MKLENLTPKESKKMAQKLYKAINEIEFEEKHGISLNLALSAPALLESLQYLVNNVSLKRLTIKNDFNLLNAHACASKTIKETLKKI